MPTPSLPNSRRSQSPPPPPVFITGSFAVTLERPPLPQFRDDPPDHPTDRRPPPRYDRRLRLHAIAGTGMITPQDLSAPHLHRSEPPRRDPHLWFRSTQPEKKKREPPRRIPLRLRPPHQKPLPPVVDAKTTHLRIIFSGFLPIPSMDLHAGIPISPAPVHLPCRDLFFPYSESFPGICRHRLRHLRQSAPINPAGTYLLAEPPAALLYIVPHFWFSTDTIGHQ